MGSLAFAGCKFTTRDCISHLSKAGFQVDLLITISPQAAAKNEVAGYQDLRGFSADRGIELRTAERYDLQSGSDQAFFDETEIDVLLVIGWERLIPEAVLDTLNVGAFGMHGSPRGLPYGRGRSPLNWSLLCDERQFRTSLFRYNADVDAGEVVGTVEFEINDFDTCKTLHFKNRMAMNLLLRRHLEDMLADTATYEPQPPGLPTYYPRRRPEDGAIDWNQPARRLHNFVRALTRPYPGAFTRFTGGTVYIWKAQPFGSKLLDDPAPPGTVSQVFADGSFLVETADRPLWVHDHEVEGRGRVVEGTTFESANSRDVLSRIDARYPSSVRPEQKEITVEGFLEEAHDDC